MNNYKIDTISITNDDTESILEGYVCDIEAENWINFLENCGQDDIFIQKMKEYFQNKKVNRIAVFSLLYVEEENRGEGLGTSLMQDAIAEAVLNSSDVIILESDIGENNEFDLTKWYKDCFDFKRVEFQTSNYPILVHFLD